MAEDSAVKEVAPTAAGPLASLVFKTTADPYVGKLTYFRVYSGTLESNTHIWNVNQNAEERIGQLFMVRGKTQEPVAKVETGDIGAVAQAEYHSHRRYPRKTGPSGKTGPSHLPQAYLQRSCEPQDQGRPGQDGFGAGASG